MFATLRTTLFKMRAAAAHPRTSVCKGRRGTPGAQAPCVIAIYAESSWMLDAPRRMRRRLRRRRPQQARGRPHGLRSRCAWRARGRSDPSGGEPSRGRLASPHETRACKSELQGGRDSSSGGAEWAGPLSAWRTRARTASERAAAPPPAWRGGWAGSSASAVGAPWRVRCRRGRELAPAVGPRQPRSRLAPRCPGVALPGLVGRVGAGPLPNAWGSARKDTGLGERRLAPTKTTRYFEEQVLRKRP